MALTPEEIERYKRHLVLHEVGGQGQSRLKAARVLVVGAGGLGSPVLLYLAAAGVGTLGIIDDDTVSLSNLQRQIVHDTASLGRSKVESAAESIRRINPLVAVETHMVRLGPDNAAEIISTEWVELVPGGKHHWGRGQDSICLLNVNFIMLRDGRIVFEGSLDELKASADPYIREFVG